MQKVASISGVRSYVALEKTNPLIHAVAFIITQRVDLTVRQTTNSAINQNKQQRAHKSYWLRIKSDERRRTMR